MKINPNQTRSLDRILDKQIGSGTTIASEGSGVKLIPGENDQIQISQNGNRLQILVNGSDKFLLTERESLNFSIGGDQKNITFDPSVTLYSNKAASAASGDPHSPASLIADGQLGHARRMESAFETAATRGVITKDLKEDPFVHHIGIQTQQFLTDIGSTFSPSALRTEKDLLPLLSQLEKTAGSVKGFPQNFIAGLENTLQKTQKDINSGAPVNLEFLGSQLTYGLKHFAAQKTQPEMHPGRIPFEAHEIPFGESQLTALHKLGVMNDAILHSDVKAIRNFANDPSFLKMAHPLEKGAFAGLLSEHSLAAGISAAEKSLNFQSIIGILHSAQSPQKFRQIVMSSGIENLHGAVKENPMEFNTTAHIFQSGDLALDLTPPPFLSNPFLNAFTPQQILGGRRQLLAAASDGLTSQTAAQFSENPLLLAIASPDEKASWIQSLQAGYVSVQDNRSIINVLQSAMTKTEFDRIVDAAGGKSIGMALHDPESILQWNRLAGAYDRMDLTTDFVEGLKNSGAFQEQFQVPGNDPVTLFPLVAAQISHGFAGDVSKILNAFITDSGKWITNQMGVLERGAYVQTGLENWNRMMDGLPFLNIPLLRNQLNSFFLQPGIHPELALNQLQTMASTLGLSTFELRNLVTLPLAFAYQTAAFEAAILGQNAVAFLKENLENSIYAFGAGSVQARGVQAQLDRVQSTFLPFADRLQSISNVLSEAVPPPADFVGGLVEFTSALDNGFVSKLVDVFPALSDVFNRIIYNTQSIDSLLLGKKPINLTTAAPQPPLLAQLSSSLTPVMENIEKLRTGELARQFSKLGQDLIQASEQRELIQLTKQTAAFLSSIHDGSYAKTLNEVASQLKSQNDPIADAAKATAEDGAFFLAQLQNGGLSKAYEEFSKQLSAFQTNNGAARINNFLQKLSSLTGQLATQTASPNLAAEALALMSPEGELRGAIVDIVRAGAAFRSSPAFRNLINLMERGTRFFGALRQGSFMQSMELINSRFGYSPAIAHVIERGLHLTTTGTTVVKTLTGREFERPLAAPVKKSETKTQAAKEIEEPLTLFPAASTFFNAVTDIEYMDVIWQYQRQLDSLKDEVLIDASVRNFEKFAQRLGSEPDPAALIQTQLNTFQKIQAGS